MSTWWVLARRVLGHAGLVLMIILFAYTAALFSLLSVTEITIAPILGKDEWRNMHFIGIGCIKDSSRDDMLKVQANLDLLARLWRNAHFVIYADAATKEMWQNETSGRNETYSFLLDDYVQENRKFNYAYEARVIRIINGRNALFKKVRQIVTRRNFREDHTLVGVIDLDDMNTPAWKVDTIQHSMDMINEWDVVSYNRPYYYDIWALRYPEYDVNCWAPGIDNMKTIDTMRIDIQSRLSQQALFEVYSAFNGLVFYKFQFIHDCDYYYSKDDTEHTNLHLCVRKQGGRVRIFNETIIDEFFKGPHRRLKSLSM